MAPFIPHSRPCVGEAESRATARVIAGRHLAQGPRVRAFEEEMGCFAGLLPGVAVSSGTAALHLSLLALDIGPGDQVLLPSYVCTAPLLAVRYTGATPVLVDADPETGNMDLDDLRKKRAGKCKAIIAVHLFGLPLDMEKVCDLGVPVVEDCAQALGAFIGERPAGTFGRLSVCSFYATKLMTTGEGGMVLSSDSALLERIRDLRDYDKRRDFKLRFNYKTTDLAAAMGRCQLHRLPSFLEDRRQLADRYKRNLDGLPCAPPPKSLCRVHYRYVVSIDSSVEQTVEALGEHGIEAASPVHRPLHRFLNLEGFPGAEACARKHLSLPLYPDLSFQEVDRVCEALKNILLGERSS